MEAKENMEQLSRHQEAERKKLALERKRKAMVARIQELKEEFEAESVETLKAISLEEENNLAFLQQRMDMAKSRKADAD